MRARRALLYMPGDDPRKILKATTLDVDCVCLDMEDGVAANRKDEARYRIAESLSTLDFGRSEVLARINSVGTGLEQEDLRLVLPSHPHGIVIPKVESAAQIKLVSAHLSAAEKKFGWKPQEIILIAIVETARGIINLNSIASASSRLEALVFGAEDFAGDVGLTRTPAAAEVFYARSALVTYAAAYNLQAIDMVFLDFHDQEGLFLESEKGAGLGFTGKQIIHPNQVEPVQRAFTPDDVSIAHAQRLVQAFEHHQLQGRGAFALDGKMIDAPLIKAAARILDRARAAGKIP